MVQAFLAGMQIHAFSFGKHQNIYWCPKGFCVWAWVFVSIPRDKSGAPGYSKLARPLELLQQPQCVCLLLACVRKTSSIGSNNQLLMFDSRLSVSRSYAHTHTQIGAFASGYLFLLMSRKYCIDAKERKSVWNKADIDNNNVNCSVIWKNYECFNGDKTQRWALGLLLMWGL